MQTITALSQEAPTKGFEIFVNTRPKKIETEYVSYEQIVKLAFDPAPPPSGEFIEITVRFHHWPRGRKGSLIPGKSTKITEGMVFYVKATDRS